MILVYHFLPPCVVRIVVPLLWIHPTGTPTDGKLHTESVHSAHIERQVIIAYACLYLPYYPITTRLIILFLFLFLFQQQHINYIYI